MVNLKTKKGTMVENIKDGGRMVNNMMKENFWIQEKTIGEKEFGMMVRELDG